MKAEAKKGSVGGKDVNFDAGISLLVPNKAYVDYEGEGLRSRLDNLQLRASRLIEDAQPGKSGADGTKGGDQCQEEAARASSEPPRTSSKTRLKYEGSADVGGTRNDEGQRRPQRRPALLESITQLTDAPRLQLTAEVRPGSLPARSNSKKRRAIIEEGAQIRSRRGSTSATTTSSAPPRRGCEFEIQPPGSEEAVTKIDLDLAPPLTGSTRARTISATAGRGEAALRPLREARRQPDRTAPGSAERRRPGAERLGAARRTAAATPGIGSAAERKKSNPKLRMRAQDPRLRSTSRTARRKL